MSTPSPPRPWPARKAAPSSVQYACPRCEEVFLRAVDAAAAAEHGLACSHCALELRGPEGPGAAPRPGQAVERCWICGSSALYVQKDFNRELGFMIVVASAMISFLVMLLVGPFEGMVCLGGIALADWLVYRKLADVTVCYLCQSIYRGLPLNEAHRGFYLGLEEKHKKLRQRWLRDLLGEGP